MWYRYCFYTGDVLDCSAGAAVPSVNGGVDGPMLLRRPVSASNVKFIGRSFARPESARCCVSSNRDGGIDLTVDLSDCLEECDYVDVDVDGDWELYDILEKAQTDVQTSKKVTSTTKLVSRVWLVDWNFRSM